MKPVRSLAAIVACLMALVPSQAVAGPGPTADAEGLKVEVRDQAENRTGHSEDHSAPQLKDCRTSPVAHMEALERLLSWLRLGDFAFDHSEQERQQATGWTVCTKADGSGMVQFLNRPGVDPTDLVVAQAQAQLQLEVPDIVTSPPRGSTKLVSIPVWFWVANTAPISTSAEIPGLRATLTAKPVRTHIEISGGTDNATEDNVTLDCPGTGTPYDRRRHDARDSSDCSHAFDWNDTYTIHATVDWALTWTATNGQNGTLPTQHRTTTFTLTIEQAQAVTD